MSNCLETLMAGDPATPDNENHLSGLKNPKPETQNLKPAFTTAG